MSIRDVCERRRMMYAAARHTQLNIMEQNWISKAKQDEAFKLFASGLNNLKIAEVLHITYPEVIALRLSYERRCRKR